MEIWSPVPFPDVGEPTVKLKMPETKGNLRRSYTTEDVEEKAKQNDIAEFISKQVEDQVQQKIELLRLDLLSTVEDRMNKSDDDVTMQNLRQWFRTQKANSEDVPSVKSVAKSAPKDKLRAPVMTLQRPGCSNRAQTNGGSKGSSESSSTTDSIGPKPDVQAKLNTAKNVLRRSIMSLRMVSVRKKESAQDRERVRKEREKKEPAQVTRAAVQQPLVTKGVTTVAVPRVPSVRGAPRSNAPVGQTVKPAPAAMVKRSQSMRAKPTTGGVARIPALPVVQRCISAEALDPPPSVSPTDSGCSSSASFPPPLNAQNTSFDSEGGEPGRLRRLMEEHTRLQAEHAKVRANMDREIDNLRLELQRSLNERQRLHEQLISTRHQLKDAMELKDFLQDERNTMADSIKDVERDAAVWKKRVEQSEMASSQLSQTASHEAKEKQKLSASIKIAESALRHFTQQLQQMLRECSSYRLENCVDLGDTIQNGDSPSPDSEDDRTLTQFSLIDLQSFEFCGLDVLSEVDDERFIVDIKQLIHLASQLSDEMKAILNLKSNTLKTKDCVSGTPVLRNELYQLQCELTSKNQELATVKHRSVKNRAQLESQLTELEMKLQKADTTKHQAVRLLQRLVESDEENRKNTITEVLNLLKVGMETNDAGRLI